MIPTHPLRLLLFPKLRAVSVTLNEGERAERLRYMVFFFLGILFWIGIYFMAYLLLQKVAAEEIYGELLLTKLLSFLFMIFFAILVFSNVVTALTTFFLSDDLTIYFSSPVSLESLYVARLLETMVNSSWMVVLFALPIFMAYGGVMQAGWEYYPWMLANLVAFIVLPSAVGVVLTMILVKVFPARKAHDVLIVVAILLVVGIYFLFRFLRPEQLFNPDIFHGVAEYFATLKTPDRYIAPAAWASKAMNAALKGERVDALFFLGLNLSNGLMAALLGQFLSRAMYLEAFSKSQEGKRARITRGPVFSKAINRFFSFLSGPMAEIVKKDIRSFFRETAQWTQLLLLLALIVVYLYNFKVLRLERIAGLTFYHINIISYFNIVLAAFVMAAVSVRFVLPAVSLEGQSFWIIRSAPVGVKAFLWIKFVMAFLPIVLVSEILIIVSNYFLHTAPYVLLISGITVFLLTLGITGLAVGIGAIYPNFKEQNVARLSTGTSSIIYMILAMALISVVVFIEFWPASMVFRSMLSGIALTPLQWLFVGISVLVVILLTLLAMLVPMRMGCRAMEEMEI